MFVCLSLHYINIIMMYPSVSLHRSILFNSRLQSYYKAAYRILNLLPSTMASPVSPEDIANAIAEIKVEFASSFIGFALATTSVVFLVRIAGRVYLILSVASTEFRFFSATCTTGITPNSQTDGAFLSPVQCIRRLKYEYCIRSLRYGTPSYQKRCDAS